MPDERVGPARIEEEGPTFIQALQMLRRRRRRVGKAKREAEEVNYLNIVAMMDMMTIILVFLLKSVSFSTISISNTDQLALPYSTTQINPLETVKIFVTKSEIVVEDKRVAEVQNGSVPDKFLDARNKYLITNLEAAVGREVTRQVRLEKFGDKFKFQGNLTILADKDTPYHVIIQVLYSAGQATGDQTGIGRPISFEKFRLMVMRSAT
jgi:biopolymer transport protein ExbD